MRENNYRKLWTFHTRDAVWQSGKGSRKELGLGLGLSFLFFTSSLALSHSSSLPPVTTTQLHSSERRSLILQPTCRLSVFNGRSCCTAAGSRAFTPNSGGCSFVLAPNSPADIPGREASEIWRAPVWQVSEVWAALFFLVFSKVFTQG